MRPTTSKDVSRYWPRAPSWTGEPSSWSSAIFPMSSSACSWRSKVELQYSQTSSRAARDLISRGAPHEGQDWLLMAHESFRHGGGQVKLEAASSGRFATPADAASPY